MAASRFRLNSQTRVTTWKLNREGLLSALPRNTRISPSGQPPTGRAAAPPRAPPSRSLTALTVPSAPRSAGPLSAPRPQPAPPAHSAIPRASPVLLGVAGGFDDVGVAEVAAELPALLLLPVRRTAPGVAAAHPGLLPHRQLRAAVIGRRLVPTGHGCGRAAPQRPGWAANRRRRPPPLRPGPRRSAPPREGRREPAREPAHAPPPPRSPRPAANPAGFRRARKWRWRLPRLQSAPSAVPRAERGPIAGPRSAGMCSDWRTERGWGGGNRLLRFLQRVARADAAHSLHDQWARAKRAAGRAAGGSSLAGGAALRGVCSPSYGRWWAPLHLHSCTRSPRAVGVPVSDNTSYPQPRSAVTALHAHWPSSPHLHSLSSAQRFLIAGTIQTCSYSLIKSVKKTPPCIHATDWCNTAHAGTPGGNISLYFAVSGGLDTTTALLALHKSPFQY